MTDEDVRSLLHSLRDEPVPADSLARVRLAVAERSEAATDLKRFVMPWKFVGLFASVALAIFIVVLLRPAKHAARPTVKVRSEVVVAAKEVPPPAVVKVERPNTVAKPRRQVAPETKLNAQDIVVRIETADPDVVILLIGD